MNVKKKVGWRCSVVGRVFVCYVQGFGVKFSIEKKKMGEEGKEGEKEEEEEEEEDRKREGRFFRQNMFFQNLEIEFVILRL